MPHSTLPSELLRAALAAAEHAYAPYSGFAVGAAVETDDGRVFAGANMENASYGLSICAEAGALQAASTAGALAAVRRIAVVGRGAPEGAHAAKGPIRPCGRCRQLIAEAAALGGRDVEVWCADAGLERVERHAISELLPHAFGPADLA
jgi:cytidine deaminase